MTLKIYTEAKPIPVEYSIRLVEHPVYDDRMFIELVDIYGKSAGYILAIYKNGKGFYRVPLKEEHLSALTTEKICTQLGRYNVIKSCECTGG